MNPPSGVLTETFRCELITEALQLAGTVQLRVGGWSMLPTIWPGDIVLIKAADQNSVRTGDIALFRRGENLTVHRILDIDETAGQILSRGDAMPQSDPSFSSRELLGKVEFVLRNGKRIEPSRNLGLAQRAMADLMQRSETAARVAVTAHQMYRELSSSS